MPFKSAYLQLTVYYVIILMAISIGFSIAIYRISAVEIGKGLGRQSRMLQELEESSPFIQDFERTRQEQVDEINGKLKTNLYYFNLLILLCATVGSYFFARSTLKPVEESYEAQARFTADASHELRTPLTAMKTEIEVALRNKKISPSEAETLLRSNLEEIAKLEALSSALLKLAKLDADAVKEFKPLLLPEVLTEAYEKVAPLADKKEITFDNEFESLEVDGDKQSLCELFVILIENAIKYSPAKSKIGISVYKADHHAAVKIKDRGMGIKASDQPHIFERFYRADHSRNKEQIAGYGLGLSIAKQIVNLHRGKISVISTPGKGSEFIIKFPKA